MAEVIWSEPALANLDAIADYIALDNPRAAAELVRRVFAHTDQLARQPRSGPKLSELPGWRYRQISDPPCRVIYRHEETKVIVPHVVRAERQLKLRTLAARARKTK